MATVNNWPLEIKNWEFNNGNLNFTAPDPDLEKRGGGGGGEGGGGLQKTFFAPSGLSLVQKYRGGGGPGPSPGFTTSLNISALKRLTLQDLFAKKE